MLAGFRNRYKNPARVGVLLPGNETRFMQCGATECKAVLKTGTHLFLMVLLQVLFF